MGVWFKKASTSYCTSDSCGEFTASVAAKKSFPLLLTDGADVHRCTVQPAGQGELEPELLRFKIEPPRRIHFAASAFTVLANRQVEANMFRFQGLIL